MQTKVSQENAQQIVTAERDTAAGKEGTQKQAHRARKFAKNVHASHPAPGLPVELSFLLPPPQV